MDLKKIKNRTVLTAAAAAAVYSFVAGKGLFNKPRFKEQHEALAKYVDTNYPDCYYTPITIHGRGWSSAVKRRGRVVSYIYFSKSREGIYVFTESKQKLK
ncbi:MAG: hypothetical protein J1G06_06025 [Oscillospiraceae bacterium]|nr:hypothetical protein [Oscillospiraceae bacterium]